MTPAVEFDGCTCTFDTDGRGTYTAVEDVSFTVAEGEFVAVVGPTGCGKSTLLNMAAGLLVPSGGEVRSFGAPVHGVNRRAGYMFQQDALLPWRTVLANAALGLRYGKVERGAAERTARDWLQRVGLGAFVDRYPAQLSGGQRRRVALAQMWATEPELILMDEPFSALDVQTRQVMENELLHLWGDTGGAVVFVTHDLDEAVGLADRIVVLSAGPASGVAGVFDVPLERPRDLLELKVDPAYRDVYHRVWECLKSEVLASQAFAVTATA